LRSVKCNFFFSTNSLIKEFIPSKNNLFIHDNNLQLSYSYALKPLQGKALQRYQYASFINDNSKTNVICYQIFENFFNAEL
jgi:hypothetical protein